MELETEMAITIDLPKAKEIWKDKIRIARKPALEKLDVDFMRATETGADTSTIVADKQILRDLPSQVDTATTTDEIQAVWNDMLNE
jgi:putative heme iron utilization protein